MTPSMENLKRAITPLLREYGALPGVSDLTKLELRGDGRPECTPESSLDSAALDVVIGS